MCFVDLGKAFDRVPRKVVEWAMRKKKNTRDDGESGDEQCSL